MSYRQLCTAVVLATSLVVSQSAEAQALQLCQLGNFQGNAGLINAAVCATHSMPHAEVQFKEFWTKNTGIVYLPGLLAASLGYNSC